MIKCPNCGAEADENEHFCKECGEKLGQPEAADENTRMENLEQAVDNLNSKISGLKPVRIPENLDKRIESLEGTGEQVTKDEMKVVVKQIEDLSLKNIMKKLGA